MFNVTTLNCVHRLQGHDGEISKVCLWTAVTPPYSDAALHQVTFDPKGSRVLTASADKTARLWDSTTGNCIQV